jgi:excisionase family DNA binding protein
MLDTIAQTQTKRAHSIQSVAEQLSVSVPFVRGEIRNGNLRAKRVKRRVLILDSDLETYLKNQDDWKPENKQAEEK